LNDWVHIGSFLYHYISIMTHNELQMKSLHIKLSWIQNFTNHNSPLWIFYQHKTQLWCGLFQPKKFYVAIFSHNKYYGYTMPKVTMISTSRNLWHNLEHNFVAASEYATSLWGAFQFSESGAHECKHPWHLHNTGTRTYDHQYQMPKMGSSKNLLHFHMQPKQRTTTHYDVHK